MGKSANDDDGEPERIWPGVSHQVRAAAPLEDTTRRVLEQRAAWASQPANVDYEQMKLFRAEQRRREKGKGKPEGLIGPPNPYKPHRKG